MRSPNEPYPRSWRRLPGDIDSLDELGPAPKDKLPGESDRDYVMRRLAGVVRDHNAFRGLRKRWLPRGLDHRTPVPMLRKKGPHRHEYGSDGFCVVCQEARSWLEPS